ncbi:MAG: glycosyltransferase family 39 protein [Planctomycetota bacterium]
MSHESTTSSPIAPKHRRRSLLTLATLLVLAALLRLIGIGWGLPSSAHLHSYHPDELANVQASRRIDWSDRQLDPGFYHHGTAYLIAVSLVDRVTEAVGLAPKRDDASPESWAATHRVARWLSWLCSVLTVWVAWLLARWRFGEGVAWVAAALTAFAPLLIDTAHVAVPDAAVTLLSIVSLALIDRLARSVNAPLGRGMIRSSIAGGAIGLAVATKLSGILLLPVLAIGLWLSGTRWRRRGLNAVASTLALAAVFVLASPPVWLATKPFFDALEYELLVHPREGHQLLFVGTDPGWRYLLDRNLPIAIGGVFAIVGVFSVLAGLLAIIWRVIARERPQTGSTELLLLIWLGMGGLALSISEVRFIRYLAPFVPALAIVTARVLLSPWALLPRLGRAVLIVLVAGVVIHTGWRGAARSLLYLGPDPRDRAASWVQENVPPGDSIGVLSRPWYYSPPISPFNGRSHTDAAYQRWCRDEAPWRMIALGLDPGRLMAEQPDWVVISSFEIAEEVRLGYPEAGRFLALVQKGYRPAAPPFQIEERLGPWKVETTDTAAGYPFPPHGWRYVNPTIWVYRKR